MHEYSIVQSLVEQVERVAFDHGATAVHRVKVKLGELSGIEVELLLTAYEICRENTICAGAPLEVEAIAVRWSCPDGHGDILRGSALTCPACGRPARLVAGDEIVLDQLDLEVP